MKTITTEELRAILSANDWNATELTMDCNGDVVVVTPCSEYPTVDFESQVDFYLLSSPSVNLCGGDDIDSIVRTLNDYEEIVAESDKQKSDLAALKARLENPEPEMTLGEWEVLYEGYSDWSKELYGFRDRTVNRPERMGSWNDPARFAAAEAEYAKMF